MDLEKAKDTVSKRDGDGDIEMDGSAGSRSQVGRRDVTREHQEGKSLGWSWDVCVQREH